MFTIRYANVGDAKAIGEIRALSWQVAYKGIVPDEYLEGFTVEKSQEFFAKVLPDDLNQKGAERNSLCHRHKIETQ